MPESVNTYRYLSFLGSRWRLIAASCSIAGALALAVSLMAPKQYTATCRILIEHPGRVFSREQLLDAVWNHDAEIEPRTVDVHVRRLRKALNGSGGRELIRTVRAAGYAFEPEGVDEVA